MFLYLERLILFTFLSNLDQIHQMHQICYLPEEFWKGSSIRCEPLWSQTSAISAIGCQMKKFLLLRIKVTMQRREKGIDPHIQSSAWSGY